VCTVRPAREDRAAVAREADAVAVYFFFITLKPRVEDTPIYEPYIRALLGTASKFCSVVVLKSRTVPNGTALSISYSRAL